MHIEMPHLLMVSYLGKRSRSIDNKCAFINKKYAITADNRQCFTSSKQPIQQALNNIQRAVEGYVYISNGQLDERSRPRPINNKYAVMNKHMHRINMS